MLDSNIAELFKYFVLCVGLLFIVGVVMVLFQLNTISDYQNRVNDTIARDGGLTASAVSDLNNVSKTSYGGIFSIDVGKSDIGAKPYGTSVDYTINMRINNPLSNVKSSFGGPVISGTRGGTAVTEIRQPQAG